jgi:hypothetical protein
MKSGQIIRSPRGLTLMALRATDSANGAVFGSHAIGIDPGNPGTMQRPLTDTVHGFMD